MIKNSKANLNSEKFKKLNIEKYYKDFLFDLMKRCAVLLFLRY